MAVIGIPGYKASRGVYFVFWYASRVRPAGDSRPHRTTADTDAKDELQVLRLSRCIRYHSFFFRAVRAS
jgi:hypothetical protein